MPESEEEPYVRLQNLSCLDRDQYLSATEIRRLLFCAYSKPTMSRIIQREIKKGTLSTRPKPKGVGVLLLLNRETAPLFCHPTKEAYETNQKRSLGNKKPKERGDTCESERARILREIERRKMERELERSLD